MLQVRKKYLPSWNLLMADMLMAEISMTGAEQKIKMTTPNTSQLLKTQRVHFVF